mgnify:CR=1 FL=1
MGRPPVIPQIAQPILVGREKPLQKVDAERGIMNAVKAFLKQSEALESADYTTQMTINTLRKYLNKDRDDFAMMLGVSREMLDQWENQLSPQQVASAMAYTIKAVDSMFRLLSFASGGPDSRPDFSLGELLKYITAEQFEQFSAWVEEGRKRVADKERDGRSLQ